MLKQKGSWYGVNTGEIFSIFYLFLGQHLLKVAKNLFTLVGKNFF